MPAAYSNYRFAVLVDDPALTFNAAHFVAFPLDKIGRAIRKVEIGGDNRADNINSNINANNKVAVVATSSSWVGEPIHGHDFRVSIRVEGPRDASGCVVDFIAAKRALVAAVACRNYRLFLARKTPCVEYVETNPTRENPNGTVEICWRGAPAPRRWVVPRDEVFWLDAENASTEEIAARLLDDWLESMEKADAFSFPPSDYRFTLRLEEAPGTSVEVTLEQKS